MRAVGALLNPSSGPVHPRAAAFLLRRAVEEQLNAYLRVHRPTLACCRTETKVVWLAHHLNPQLAGRLATVWRNLSGACHHQQFALPPTMAELLGWYDEVTFLLRALPV
jgi:glycine/D-amino acid oxidase-like deaminating enzyme